MEEREKKIEGKIGVNDEMKVEGTVVGRCKRGREELKGCGR